MVVATVVRLTLKEVQRSRLALLLLVLTFVGVALSAWGFGRLPGLATGLGPTGMSVVASQLLILVMFMWSGLLAVGSAVLAATSLAGERESGVALALLARPVRRGELYLGKWLGLVVQVVGYTAFSTALEVLIVYRATGVLPSHPFVAGAFMAAEGTVMVTLGLALGTRLPAMTGGVVGAAAFFLDWLAGVVGAIGQSLHNPSLTDVGTVAHLLLPTDGLWHGAMFGLESQVALLFAQFGRLAEHDNPFFAAAPLSTAYILWVVVWLALVFAIGLGSFSHQDA